MARYFQALEFKCKCGRAECSAPRVSDALLERLDRVRMRVGYALYVNSGVRCAFWNEHEGGEKNSEHMIGTGADIRAESGREKYVLVQAALAEGFRRIGIGRTFVHLGVSQQHDQDVIWQYGSR